jgi:hypothetical protein
MIASTSASPRVAASKAGSCAGQLRTAAGLRINVRRPASVKYAVGGIGCSGSGPTIPSPPPPRRWQSKQLAMKAVCPRRAGASSGTNVSTAIADQRCTGEGTTVRRLMHRPTARSRFEHARDLARPGRMDRPRRSYLGGGAKDAQGPRRRPMASPSHPAHGGNGRAPWLLMQEVSVGAARECDTGSIVPLISFASCLPAAKSAMLASVVSRILRNASRVKNA